MSDLAKLIADVQGPYDLNAPFEVLYGAHTVKDILAALHRAEAMERALDTLLCGCETVAKSAGINIDRECQEHPECPFALARRALAPAATKENRVCGSQGVDHDGHCLRCGLLVEQDVDADRDECPPGFFAATKVGEQVVYLIESPGEQPTPMWWTGDRWTKYAHNGKQFPTRHDAETALRALSGFEGIHSPFGKVTEHIFIDNKGEAL